MASSTLLSVFLLSTLLVSSQAYSGSLAAPRDFQKRSTYNGGWPLGLPGPTCPAEAPVACQDPAKAINPTCCPTGQTCFGFSSPYCCPTDTDCGNVVNNVPVCANSTWNMYEMLFPSTTYICCEPGTVGVIPISGSAGMCEPPDADTPSSRLAKLASQIGGPAITGVATATGGNAATPTVTFTGVGKGQTTITSTPTAGGAVTSSTSSSTATNTAAAGSGSNTSSGMPKTFKTVLHNIHLSTGEIIGIAVGGAAVIALIVALIVCCCRRRRRNRVVYVQPYARSTAYEGSGNQMGPAEPLYAPVPNPYAPYATPQTEYQTPLIAAREQMRGEMGYDER